MTAMLKKQIAALFEGVQEVCFQRLTAAAEFLEVRDRGRRSASG